MSESPPTSCHPLWNPLVGHDRHVRHARHAVMGKARLWPQAGIPCGIPGWGHGSYSVTPLWAHTLRAYTLRAYTLRAYTLRA